MVKWQFLTGVAAGLVYAAATGAGLPLMTQVVFPVLFNDTAETSQWYVSWLTSWLGEISRNELLIYTCLWIPVVFLVRAAAAFTTNQEVGSSLHSRITGVTHADRNCGSGTAECRSGRPD